MVALPFLRYEKTVGKPHIYWYPEHPKTIGEHIRKRRMDLHLLQSDVAEILNICIDSITGWENGRSEPQIHFYPRIIDFLGYNPFETSKETIGTRIKAYRLTHGLSQKKMGKLISVDGSTICSWENGITVPNRILLEKVNMVLQNEAT